MSTTPTPETERELLHTIELRGVFDGVSIFVYTDGTMVNRWADGEGNPVPGYEYRFEVTQEEIDRMRAEQEDSGE